MGIVIAYNGGPHPDRNRDAFFAELRKRYPNATQYEYRYLYKRAVANHDQLNKRRSITLFGMDIMTEDPEKIAAWRWLPQSHRDRILSHPLGTGTAASTVNDRIKISKLELARSLERRGVNRSVLVSPEGLQQTYVWRRQTEWKQEVTEHDFLLIRAIPQLASRFQRVDLYGDVQIIRSYDMVPKERHIARDASDVAALKREFDKKVLYKGASLP